MSLRQYLKEVKERALQRTFHEFPPEHAEAATQYADAAYRSCITWFGLPLDPQKPYFIQATAADSFCFPMPGKYYLAISEEAVIPEHLCYEIAHEMYHRVTANRQGLAGEMWIQEIMAHLTSDWFLRQQGFSGSAEAVKKHLLATPGTADISLLRASRRRRGGEWILRGGEVYSPEFVHSVVRISYALLRAVKADDLCRLSQAKTLEVWIDSLPQQDQYAACRILELPTGDKFIPDEERLLDRLFLCALSER